MPVASLIPVGSAKVETTSVTKQMTSVISVTWTRLPSWELGTRFSSLCIVCTKADLFSAYCGPWLWTHKLQLWPDPQGWKPTWGWLWLAVSEEGLSKVLLNSLRLRLALGVDWNLLSQINSILPKTLFLKSQAQFLNTYLTASSMAITPTKNTMQREGQLQPYTHICIYMRQRDADLKGKLKHSAYLKLYFYNSRTIFS